MEIRLFKPAFVESLYIYRVIITGILPCQANFSYVIKPITVHHLNPVGGKIGKGKGGKTFLVIVVTEKRALGPFLVTDKRVFGPFLITEKRAFGPFLVTEKRAFYYYTKQLY